MAATTKLLVVGPPEGPQGRFVSAISEVKVRSSARTATGEGTVPMDFGRVRIGVDLDLQLFGFDRDRVSVVADAVAPGIVGAVLLVGGEDTSDPHFASNALDELASRGVPVVLAIDGGESELAAVKNALNASSDMPVIPYANLDRDTVKSIVVAALGAAVSKAEGSAA